MTAPSSLRHLLLLSLLLANGACDQSKPDKAVITNPATHVSAETKAEKCRRLAGEIVKAPTNWRDNCVLMQQFAELKTDLHWEAIAEIHDFEVSVQDLIESSAGWVQSLDETRTTELGKQMTGIAGKIEISTTGARAGSEGKWEDVQQNAVEAVKRSEIKLTAAEAANFGLRYRQLMQNYSRLLIYLRDLPNAATTPTTHPGG